MMTQTLSQEEKFQQMLESLYATLSEEDGLQKFRERAWRRFQEVSLPNKHTEVYQYIKLRQLFNTCYSSPEPAEVHHPQILPHVYPECRDSYLVFVNGGLRLDLSRTTAIHKNVVVQPMSRAIKTYGTFLNNHYNKWLKEERDPFALLNGAMQQESLFIYIPPKTHVEAPVQMIYLTDAAEEAMLVHPRTHIYVGSSSEVHLYANDVSLTGERYGINRYIDFTVDPDSHVKYVQTVLQQPAQIWYFDAVRASLKRDSSFKSVNVNDGCGCYRNDYLVALAQENGQAELDGMWMMSGKRESHTNVLVDHQAPHCNSRQFFKSVLRDTSRTSFEGKIYVHKEAQKTDAFQLNNNILLDEHAHADCKPNLEIFADDVKASHGSTFGQLDPEQIFYMKSRGFSDTEAKNLLIYGYCKEIIDRVPLPSLYKDLKEKTQSYMAH